jgi:DNA-binding transcriptional LysR family regulator
MNFRTLDLNLLRVFDAVMAERNLTRAAERLSLTQPAVSNALKRLRDSVGEELLTRIPHGVKPTARAEALWPEVRVALEQLQAAFEPSRFDPQFDGATFRIAMSDGTAVVLMPPLIEHVERTGALVNLRVLPLVERDPRPLLASGDADAAVGYFPEAVARMLDQGPADSLRRERLYDSGYVCVMRKDHPLAGTALTLDAFCDAHHLLMSLSGQAHGAVEHALAALGRARRIVATVNQYHTAGRIVVHSNLLTVLPTSLVATTGFADRLEVRALPFAVDALHIDLLWHLRNDAAPAQRWLRRRLAGAARAATAG